MHTFSTISFTLMLLFVVGLPLQAQETGFKLGPLTLGQSGQQDLANFLGEEVGCADLPYQHQGQPLEYCAPRQREQTETHAQAILVEGKVHLLRYLLDPRAQLQSVGERLVNLYGEPVRTGKAIGLRYWEFDPGTGCVLLSEVRPGDQPESGPVRLRISVLNSRGDWMKPLPGGFTGCERVDG